MTKIAESLRMFLRDLIDYAGLFPPAALDMERAVRNYRSYLEGEFWWATGRFVVPAARLHELEQFIPTNQPSPWALSVLVGPKLESDVSALREFALHCSKLAFIDCVETKVASAEEVEKVHGLIGPTATTYYETPLTAELTDLLDTIKNVNGRAKIRTGGVTPEAFPSPESVASFLVECAKHRVPFKATAGLHHPVRCRRPLTYEPNAPTGEMHGFLNMFVAAACVWAGETTVTCTSDFSFRAGMARAPYPFRVVTTAWQLMRLLQCEEPFDLRDDGVHGAVELPLSLIEDTRRNFAISFGSCSFEEPIADLKALNLL